MTNIKLLRSYQKQMDKYISFLKVIGQNRKKSEPIENINADSYLKLINEIARLNKRIEFIQKYDYKKLMSESDCWTIERPSKLNIEENEK